jgi:hypothetical protein
LLLAVAREKKEMEEEIICNRWKDLDGRRKKKENRPAFDR